MTKLSIATTVATLILLTSISGGRIKAEHRKNFTRLACIFSAIAP